MRARVVMVLVLAVALSSCGAIRDRARARLLGGDDRRTVTVDGRQRVYYVHRPSSAPHTNVPLVFLFHGGTGTAPGMQRIAHFDKVADAHGFLAVYPEGYKRSWNDGRPNTPAAKDHVDDVKFVSVLIDRLAADEGIDRSRVFAGGLSNGGFFSQRLGCDLADKIKAIAPVAGTMGTEFAPTCHPSRPVSVLEIHGTDDPLIPFDGGQDKGRNGGTTDISVMEAFAMWRTFDACPDPTVADLPDKVNDGTHVVVHTSRPCQNGSAVQLYVVEGGGHTWPGGEQYLPALLVGKTSHQFDASETIWQFFASLS